MGAKIERWVAAHPITNGLVGFITFAVVGTVTSFVLGDGIPWMSLSTVAFLWVGVLLAAHVTTNWTRLRWRARSIRFRYFVALAIAWACWAVLFTVVDDGDVGFGLFGGGLVAFLFVSVITFVTLVFGRPDRGWYLRR